MEDTKRKIIFIDDSAKQIPTLIDILKNGFAEFKTNYGNSDYELPEIAEIVIDDWIDPEEFGEKYEKYLKPVQPLKDYYLIDICLTDRESKLSASELKLTETSGYKLAELIKKSDGFNGHISIISRILSAAKGSNIENNQFGTIIKKPLDPNGDAITMLSAGNQYTSDLPRELLTRDMQQAFCNMIFYNYFKFIEK